VVAAVAAVLVEIKAEVAVALVVFAHLLVVLHYL
jgi:hypothetical protein